MRNSLYPRLAAQNIKKNSKYYLPYIITGILSVAMFFIVLSLQTCDGLNEIYGGAQLASIMGFALVVATILFTIFLFYNQSFLIKRRKTEFGLYSVLGMEKKHISRMCMLESLYITVMCIIGGLIVGTVFSKLAFLALLKIINVDIPLEFQLNFSAIGITVAIFLCIFTLIFFNTVRQIYCAKTVELLHSSKVGEKEPKAKWIVTIAGIISLGAGYAIALTTKSPLEAIPLFTFAVILVMIGTYCLFTSGSIQLLKCLKKNKNYYYKTKHFVSVSGMIYRMKQNAIGLGNICIFCTAVLVIISTTVSLYSGMEDVLRNRFPRNMSVDIISTTDEMSADVKDHVDSLCAQYSISSENVIEYNGAKLAVIQKDGNTFSATAAERENDIQTSNIAYINFITIDDYNRFTGKNAALNSDETFVCEVNGEIEGNEINFGDYKLKIKEKVNDIDLASGQTALMFHTYYIVIPDFEVANKAIQGATDGEITTTDKSYYYGFDTNAEPKEQIDCYEAINDYIEATYPDETIQVENAESSRNSFYALYGGLLFIGIFLGIIFIFATVLIIYYKQISEGYDDRERFEIMQKVGMDREEIRKSINSQVLTVFFLPLVTAFIHLAVAFPIMTKLLALLQLTNIGLFATGLVITAVIFAVMYAIVYAMTAKVYYRIVK